jgi:hypothetical protein
VILMTFVSRDSNHEMVFYCEIKELCIEFWGGTALRGQVGSLTTSVGYVAQHCTVQSFHDHGNIDLSQVCFVVGKVQCQSGN